MNNIDINTLQKEIQKKLPKNWNYELNKKASSIEIIFYINDLNKMRYYITCIIDPNKEESIKKAIQYAKEQYCLIKIKETIKEINKETDVNFFKTIFNKLFKT